MKKRLCMIAIPSIALIGTNYLIAEPPATYDANSPATAQQKPKELPSYEPKNYDKLLGKVDGISDAVLQMHFKLYQGYVANTNKLLKQLQEMNEKGETKTPEYAGLKRMFGWEFDGMRLHEYYFDNLGGGKPLDKSSSLYQRIEQNFGSFQKWKNDFISTGLIRGIGWVVLYAEPRQGRLVNEWINEHDLGHLAGGAPLLIMDVFEHAYITQYGLDRASYIDAFFKNINWDVVSARYQEFSTKLLAQ